MAISRPRPYGFDSLYGEDNQGFNRFGKPNLVPDPNRYGKPNINPDPNRFGRPNPNSDRRGGGGSFDDSKPRRGGGGSFGRDYGAIIDRNATQRKNENRGIGEVGQVGKDRSPGPIPRPEQPEWFTGNIADFLAQALGMVGSGVGGIEARQASARQQQAEGDAKIAAMYAQLDSALAQRIPEINQQTTANTESSQAGTAEAQAAMQASRDANRQAEADTMGRTQIGDSQLLQDQRSMADTDSEGSVGRVNERGQANQQYIGAMGDISRDVSTSNRNLSALTGTETRAQNVRGLNNLLAQLEDEKQANIQQSRQSAIGLASDMYNSAYGRFSDEVNYNQGVDDRGWDRGLALSDRKTDNESSRFQNESSRMQLAMEMASQQAETDASQVPQTGLTSAQSSIINTLMDKGRMTAPDAVEYARGQGWI